jgi:hypothetical protein
MDVEGRHISAPPPHPGELAPGPLLAIGSVGSPLYTTLIDNFTDDLIQKIAVAHDNPDHLDTMTTSLIDLNPANKKSVTAGLYYEFRMVINLSHVPVPESSTYTLFMVGAIIFFAANQTKRRKLIGT